MKKTIKCHQTADLVAGAAFRNTLVERADAHHGPAPLWHGWALMDAFLAGVAYGRSTPAISNSIADKDTLESAAEHWNARAVSPAPPVSADGVPDGWQLVPKEPVRAMTLRACDHLPVCDEIWGHGGEIAAAVWRAMLAAAPDSDAQPAPVNALIAERDALSLALGRAQAKASLADYWEKQYQKAICKLDRVEAALLSDKDATS